MNEAAVVEVGREALWVILKIAGPIMGAGLAIVFLGEHLRGFHAIGMALIVGGILLAGRGTKPLAGAVVSSKTNGSERRNESE